MSRQSVIVALEAALVRVSEEHNGPLGENHKYMAQIMLTKWIQLMKSASYELFSHSYNNNLALQPDIADHVVDIIFEEMKIVYNERVECAVDVFFRHVAGEMEYA